MYNQQGQHGHGQQHQQGGNLRQNRYGGKSTSAESVLTVNGRGGSGQAGHGQQAHSTSKNYDQYGNNPSTSSSAGMKSSNGVNGSDQSSSPQSSNSESQLTPPEDHRSADQRSNGGNGNS